MSKKNTIRLIIWGLLFVIFVALGIVGLSTSKAQQRINNLYDNVYQE